MKKTYLLMIMLLLSLSVPAKEYTYLTFAMTDGSKASIPAANATITCQGTTLSTGEKTFVISNLQKMYFSTSNETVTGITSVSCNKQDNIVAVYNLQGKIVDKADLTEGIYIIQTSNKNYKLAIK